MKHNFAIFRLLKLGLGCLFALCFASIAFAKEIPLYDQPKTDAKAIGTVDLSAGVIPIYTPKDNTAWVKIADPRNGNVGWVKSSDMSGAGGPTFTFTQRVYDNGKAKGANTYQVIEYGQPQKASGQQLQDWVQQMQTRQRELQQELQYSIQQMLQQINTLSQHTLDFTNQNPPIIMPIVVVPEKKPAGAQSNQTTPTKTPTSTTIVKPKSP